GGTAAAAAQPSGNAALAAAADQPARAPLPEATSRRALRRRFLLPGGQAGHRDRRRSPQRPPGCRLPARRLQTSLGLRVIRIPAADVLADPEQVADAICRLCEGGTGPSTTQPGG